MSMLVPLQTLFGWPPAPNPSPLLSLGLLAGLPIVVIVLVFAVAKIGDMARVARTGGGVQASDPIWMGGRAKSIMGGADMELTEVADSQRAQLSAGEDTSDGPDTAKAAPEETGTGGAGARW